MALKNQPTNRAPCFLDQNQPIRIKTSKSSQNDSRRLTDVHHCQAIQTNPRKTRLRHASPSGQDHITNRFLFRNPKTHKERMSCLAAVHHPPGSFWKIPKTRNSYHKKNICIQLIILFIPFKRYKLKERLQLP